MELPTKRIEPTEKNPKFSIFFGKPKSGKSTICAALEDALLVDMENGSTYLNAMKVDASSFAKLKELKDSLQAAYIKNSNQPVYTYGVFDTATAMEDIIMVLAVSMYKNTPMGKSFDGDDVRKLPNGAGYLYIREAFINVINGFKPFFKYMILLGHTKDKMINRQGKELSENALDLSGKLERIIASQADALGFVYRKKNQTIINFNGGEDCIVEARPDHLRGQEIVVAETDENNNFTFHWDRVFK